MENITIALAGNPNCGKTTLFNLLTGSNQFVGNWPGVTVEKKEGHLKKHANVIITDLPGIYSLSPYTLEEVVARDYLADVRPDAILNIVDGTSLERSLFLTSQLMELGIPVVVAINMMDIVEKSGEKIDTQRLAAELGCPIVEISALKGTGAIEAAETAIGAARRESSMPRHSFSGQLEHTLAHIEEAALHDLPEDRQRYYAIKLFERDKKIAEKLGIDAKMLAHINNDIIQCETALGDDSEAITISERYAYIDSIIAGCINLKKRGRFSISDKIDRVVTNRFAALPIFVVVIFLVYFISVTTIGAMVTNWANDGVFGEGWHLTGGAAYANALEIYEAAEASDSGLAMAAPDPADYGIWVPGIPVAIGYLLESVHCADWLQGLILDGIVAGVGSVLGFVPQILVLFLLLAILEACGYMARIAFIMDKIFRRFGLSGKSFIPILIGTGCGVPGIMASRTIESDRDRKMTIITTTFIPCSAKLPIIALIAGALFGGAWWIAPSAYFIGIAAILFSGLLLKKTSLFSGDVAPFVMELPAYHLPLPVNVLRSMWERGWSFIKKAGTVILLAAIVIWFTSGFGWDANGFGMVDMDESIMAHIGSLFAWIFAPLGWGNWQAAVAALMGLVAKENVLNAFAILYHFGEVSPDGVEMWGTMATAFTQLSAYSFLVFNLLCAPCFAAMGAILREMNNAKWFWIAIGYQCGLAYVISLCIYQLGMLFTTGNFTAGSLAAILCVLFMLYMLLRPERRTGVRARAESPRLC